MHSESNPLMRELAKAWHPGPHPEADVLTAFAEGTLLKRERTDVLQHLANCAECREVVHTSMDATPEVSAERKVSASPAGWGYRQWMPWAVALAASLLVVTTVTVHRHSSKPDSNKSDYIAKVEQPVPPTNQVRQTPLEAPKKKAATRPASARQNNSIPAEESRSQQAELQNTLRARSLSASRFAPAAPTAQAAAKDLQLAQTPGVQQETQNVQLAQGAANAQPAMAALAPPNSTDEVVREETLNGALARTAAAAPAPAAKPSFMAGAISPNAAVTGTAALLHWRISPEGRVEREIGAGQWETMLALEPAKMRVVTVYGRTVWAGGDSPRLYRSTDNGATWSSVALPNKGTAPHAIAHILFTSPDAGTAEAEDGTQWTTTDGGASWR